MAARGAEFIGTMAVQDKHRFDVGALERFMAGHVEGFRAPLAVEQFRGGQSNPTYRLSDGAGRRYVLRRKPPGKLLPSAHAVDREFRVIAALNKTDVPTPRAYALCEDDGVIGTAFYIMEFCDGRVLWDPMLPDQTPAMRRAIYEAKVDVLARLHKVDYQAVGLGDFGRPGSYVARQIKRWGGQYKASQTETIEAMDRLLEWLPANAPQADSTTIVHGDYRLDNMIYHSSEPRVLAVIDWEISTLGDPLAELSYLCMMHRVPQEQGGMQGVDIAALGIPGEAEMVDMYGQRTGRASVPDWEFYMAYNLFRIACIRQGVYARGLDGTASNLRAVDSGRLVRPNAELAWHLAQGLGAR
ncbi:MAG: phosphotransferase family protein [Alphaproteobacteria bacterium]|nr:phosphotransferase family protein [Alphaproteobacteria bacterium]MCW5742513.1 phosphotransferase family protein [Alphaproteobacteria bacterium]